jgi:hypothetical protein
MVNLKNIRWYISYSVALLIAIILPLIIWRLNLPIIESTYDGTAPNTIDSQPFELFGFFTTILLVTKAYLKIKQNPRRNLTTLVPIILPILVFLELLFIQIESFHVKSSDFMCYENAARAILNGLNPYAGDPSCYLYPPLLAQALFWTHQIAVYNPLLAFTDDIKSWTIVSYFYQCAQFLQVILAYYLTLFLAQHLKIKALPASLITSALFIFNYPLARTLTFDQVNLWILNSFLLGLLLINRAPFFAGLAVALGGHIKLYTLILLLPWLSTKRWKAILGAFVGFITILIIQTNFLQDLTFWNQFLLYFRNPERPSNYRNNSIWSLIFNSAKIPSKILHIDVPFNIISIVVSMLSLLIFIWFVFRFIQRERIHSKIAENVNEVEKIWLKNVFRFYGHSIDAIALSLLLSPSVWEHHYVLAIPIALWSLVTRKSEHSLLVYLAVFLIVCIPSYEIFPLSFYRLFGLLTLVYLTTPHFIQDYFILKSGHKYTTLRA